MHGIDKENLFNFYVDEWSKDETPLDPAFLASLIRRCTKCACCEKTLVHVRNKRASLMICRVDASTPISRVNSAVLCKSCSDVKRDFAPEQLRNIAEYCEIHNLGSKPLAVVR